MRHQSNAHPDCYDSVDDQTPRQRLIRAFKTTSETSRPFFANIVLWRDATVHRISPLVIVHSPGAPENTPRNQQEIKLLDDPDPDLWDAISQADKQSLRWVEPLHFHNQWKPKLLSFCGDMCDELKQSQ